MIARHELSNDVHANQQSVHAPQSHKEAAALPTPIPLALPPDSDLELVETRHAPPPSEPEPVARSGPRRTRPPRVSVADEPLQIVETRGDGQPPAGS